MSDPCPLQLPAVFSHHGVLQRDHPLPVWGRAPAGVAISVWLGEHRASTITGTDGRWQVVLPALPAGGPHSLFVTGDDGSEIAVHDLLVGEVVLCAGQSNMSWPAREGGFKPEDFAGPWPGLRLLKIPERNADTPQDDFIGSWFAADSASLAEFSGLGFAVGRELWRELAVPVGLVQCCWTASSAQAWIRCETLAADPDLAHLLGGINPVPEDDPSSPPGRLRLQAWFQAVCHDDPGIAPAAADWHRPGHSHDRWQGMRLPVAWERVGLDIDGAVWFRRIFDLPEAPTGPTTLRLGCIADWDHTWINGTQVGRTGPDLEWPRNCPRTYPVAPGTLVAGRNEVMVRVFNRMEEGGLITGPFLIDDQAGTVIADLGGTWLYRIEQALAPKRPSPIWPFPVPQTRPTLAGNGMIAPLAPFAARCVVYYQGEANADQPDLYRRLLQAVVTDWRGRWGWEIPFLIAQVNAWMPRRTLPRDSAWARIREGQSLAALLLPRVWRSVSVDSGHELERHPRNKPLLGRRLALLFRRHLLGDATIPADSPRYLRHLREGEAIRVFLAHADGLTTTDSAPPKGFALAGPDRKWRWAQARIEGDSVVVSTPVVPDPVAVRYAWADTPNVNLINAAGLPCDGFRTDDWPWQPTSESESPTERIVRVEA